MANTETEAYGAPSQTHPGSLVGQIVSGCYRILRKLGEGEAGEVYAAELMPVGQPVAIKVLYKETASSTSAMARYFEQARSASSIGHRNIAGIVEFGQIADGRAYLCTELLTGAALRDLLSQPMAVDRLLSILLQAGQGLAAAHARGIVHRDLKPENIFVAIGPSGEDVPKLLDFGIADASGNDDPPARTRAGTISSMPFYLAPEQVWGKPVDARTDIYALGAILYECFSGTPPFHGDSPMAIAIQRLQMEPEPVTQRAAEAGRQLPAGLAEVITRCLQKDPAQRFQTMDELVAALGQIQRDIAEPDWDLPTRTSPALPDTSGPRPMAAGVKSGGPSMPGAGALPGSAERVIAAPGSAGAYPGGAYPGGPGPSSVPSLDVPDSAAAQPLALDENVQFTVYRPRAIAPLHWYSLLAFAHLAERRPGELDAPDPLDEVRHQAEAMLGEHAAAYQSTTQDSGAAIPAEGELVFVVEIPGVEVNPPRRSFLWTEPVHREEFRIRAGAQIVGTTARGRLTVFLGCIVIAELPLAVRVDAAPATTAVEHTQVRTYRRIFASYSHRDGAIVDQFQRYARALGDEYLRDSIQLRSGQVWSYQLLRMIEQADAFQLFWSHNSMHSIYVRQEYEYALSLHRPSFVRPTYWEDPMPTAEGLPPEALRRLHFQKLGGSVEPPQPKGLEFTAPPSGTSSHTGSVASPPMMPPYVLTPPREHTGAHEILAPDPAENQTAVPRKRPQTLELLIERDEPAPHGKGDGQPPRNPFDPPDMPQNPYGQQPGWQQNPYGQQPGMHQPAPPHIPQRPSSQWPAARSAIVLALGVLVLLAVGFLLRWIF